MSNVLGHRILYSVSQTRQEHRSGAFTVELVSYSRFIPSTTAVSLAFSLLQRPEPTARVSAVVQKLLDG